MNLQLKVVKYHGDPDWLVNITSLERNPRFYAKAQCHNVFSADDKAQLQEDARRIVACVNALQHVSTEQLETGEVLSLSQQAVDLRRQRDELLAALEGMLCHIREPESEAEFQWPHHFPKQKAAFISAREAIAKARGEA